MLVFWVVIRIDEQLHVMEPQTLCRICSGIWALAVGVAGPQAIMCDSGVQVRWCCPIDVQIPQYCKRIARYPCPKWCHRAEVPETTPSPKLYYCFESNTTGCQCVQEIQSQQILNLNWFTTSTLPQIQITYSPPFQLAYLRYLVPQALNFITQLTLPQIIKQ